MLCNKQICQLLVCFVLLQMACAYPSQSQRLTAADIETSLTEPELQNLYKYERTLGRLRRALKELEYDEAVDDLELAEINVFRPLFRYRAEIARQVKNPQQRQFG